MLPASEQYFVLTLPLYPQVWQQHILEKRFEVNRQIYNGLLAGASKRYRQMAQTRAWRANQEALGRGIADTTEGRADLSDKQVRKAFLQEQDRLLRQYRLTRFDLCHDATAFRQHFKEHTDSPITQNLANDVWKAIDSLVKGRSRQIHEKGMGQLRSLSGKTNRSSIRFRNGCMEWKGLVLPAGLKNNSYEQQALKNEIRYCRIKREYIRGKERYFAELVLKGRIPVKEPSKALSCQEQTIVGLELGFRKLALVSREEAVLYELPVKSRSLEKRKQILAGFLERSRRSMNPQNYLADGRIRAGDQTWRFSKHYQRTRLVYQELCRKQRVLQREAQRRLAGEVAERGTHFYIEENRYEKLGRVKPNGAWIQKTSPATFQKLLEQRILKEGKELIFVQPFLLKASGFNHHTGVYQKMPLRKEWRTVDGRRVDKKLYSAFLLSNVAEDLKSFDLDRCSQQFPGFLRLQDAFFQSLQKQTA